MAQAKIVEIRMRPGCAAIRLDMYPERAIEAVEVTVPSQYFTPPELRVLARLLEQAADRKEELFTVTFAS